MKFSGKGNAGKTAPSSFHPPNPHTQTHLCQSYSSEPKGMNLTLFLLSLEMLLANLETVFQTFNGNIDYISFISSVILILWEFSF